MADGKVVVIKDDGTQSEYGDYFLITVTGRSLGADGKPGIDGVTLCHLNLTPDETVTFAHRIQQSAVELLRCMAQEMKRSPN